MSAALALACLVTCASRPFHKTDPPPPELYYSRPESTLEQFKRDSRDCTISAEAEVSRSLLAVSVEAFVPGNPKLPLASAKEVWQHCMTRLDWQKVSERHVDLNCTGAPEEEYIRFAPPECLRIELPPHIPGSDMKILRKEPDAPESGPLQPAE